MKHAKRKRCDLLTIKYTTHWLGQKATKTLTGSCEDDDGIASNGRHVDKFIEILLKRNETIWLRQVKGVAEWERERWRDRKWEGKGKKNGKLAKQIADKVKISARQRAVERTRSKGKTVREIEGDRMREWEGSKQAEDELCVALTGWCCVCEVQ